MNSPPEISHGYQIEVFGPKGKEHYNVKKIHFHGCHFDSEQCVHNIFMTCRTPWSPFDNQYTEFVTVNRIPYSELVKKGYIKFLTKENQKQLMNTQKCKLSLVPAG